jgi:hypothetical protein
MTSHGRYYNRAKREKPIKGVKSIAKALCRPPVCARYEQRKSLMCARKTKSVMPVIRSKNHIKEEIALALGVERGT